MTELPESPAPDEAQPALELRRADRRARPHRLVPVTAAALLALVLLGAAAVGANLLRTVTTPPITEVPDREEGVASWRLDLSMRSPSASAAVATSSQPPDPTPYAPPSPLCPAPARAVEPPAVAATTGGGGSVLATLGSYLTMTCSTTGVSDAAPTSPSDPLLAEAGATMSLSVPTGWRFVHWEGWDAPVAGEGANVSLATDLTVPSSVFEVPVPNRTGDSTLGFDVVVVSLDGRVVMSLSVQVLVRVG